MINYGHGISLAPLDRESVEPIRHWRNDPAIYKWCRQTGLITDADQVEWYDRQRRDPSIRMFIIVDGQKAVGVCGLTSIDLVCRRAEFSLYIAPAFHQMGLGRRALSTLLDFGFKTLGLHSIWGETFDGNPALKLFDRLGFQREGVRRDFYFKDGKFINAHLISLQASEWESAKCSAQASA